MSSTSSANTQNTSPFISNQTVTSSNTSNTSTSYLVNQPPTDSIKIINEDECFERNLLLLAGYIKIKHISDTLQGSIFIAKNLNLNNNKYNNKTVVIKRASKILHNNCITIYNNRKYSISENIIKECKIMKYLTCNPSISSTHICKFIDFFESKNNYYLVMQNCGKNLFKFVLDSHKLILQNKLTINEWRKCGKYLFFQMICAVNYLHSCMNTCHLDISLENMTVINSNWIYNQNTGYYTLNPHTSNSFLCEKYVGKRKYKSPEIYNKQRFDARCADIYSLGVVLFCMSTGNFPYNKACDSDYLFKNYIKHGHIAELICKMSKQSYISLNCLTLIRGMMNINPSQRYLCKDIISHPWLSCYVNQ